MACTCLGLLNHRALSNTSSFAVPARRLEGPSQRISAETTEPAAGLGFPGSGPEAEVADARVR